MPELIDTHCHLDFPVLRQQSSILLQAAADVGVSEVVVPGVLAENWEILQQFCASDIRLKPAFGLHPCFMSQHSECDLQRLPELLTDPATVAVGEIGLDLFIEGADLNAQRRLLVAQLQLAKQTELPVLLHVRKAHDQMLKELRQLRLPRGGIVHAFSGSLQQARQYIALGFLLGFGGALSYERATKLRALVAELPLEAIVLETDAPDMPLSQWRGQPNRPERVAEVAQLIAQLRGIELAEVAAVTTASARQLLALR
ncbi:MAG: TatD family hydrolase [Marinobacterium sp.]|nr:TatD family hydrolase [Marinobacterium sp.]